MTSHSVYDSIVCFGDSLTARGAAAGGHVASMTEAYLGRLDVVNRGYSGYTTREAVAMASTFFVPQPEGSWVPPAQRWAAARSDGPAETTRSIYPPHVRLALVWFGANDAALEGQRQHTPLNEYESNLRKVIEIIRSAHSSSPSLAGTAPPRILLLTPPPIYSTSFLGDSRSIGATSRYRETVLHVGETSGEDVLALDIFHVFQTHEAKRLDRGGQGEYEGLLDPDGLHLGKDGYKLVFKEVMALIRSKWPDLAPEAIPLVFPPWTALQRNAGQTQLDAQLFANVSR